MYWIMPCLQSIYQDIRMPDSITVVDCTERPELSLIFFNNEKFLIICISVLNL